MNGEVPEGAEITVRLNRMQTAFLIELVDPYRAVAGPVGAVAQSIDFALGDAINLLCDEHDVPVVED